MVVQREQEIHQIVQSIHELNEIFRDVAQMVVDQVSTLNIFGSTYYLAQNT